MNLIDNQIEIIPVHNSTDQRKALITYHVTGWCLANANLVGHYGASQGCYALPNGDRMGSDSCVIFNARWNALTNVQQGEAFPPVVPNFVIELRSHSDLPQYIHNRMLRWINNGVEESWSIDHFINPPEVRIYTFNANTNQVTWQILVNPTQVTSQVLNGFVMNMQGIF
ncbi:hypothetical protein C1645_828551 [Glomus cerebriforme]|uniref:Putative restriction endonuclease domain-containing protein n=1 Tax=Glomus cerebriforme TaxID=658196 RepID=A0A397SQK8_9GLOM|nr:hypothetical protein C1645_828551 [Glomus cerebriforme]